MKKVYMQQSYSCTHHTLIIPVWKQSTAAKYRTRFTQQQCWQKTATGNLCLCWHEALNWRNVQLREPGIYLLSPADTIHPSPSIPSPETFTKYSSIRQLKKKQLINSLVWSVMPYSGWDFLTLNWGDRNRSEASEIWRWMQKTSWKDENTNTEVLLKKE